ncbi:S-methyl-5'-thioadenosine phosphorylase [Clonorchis sinensis]|uniref:S-methyl-5'-thioadenosine phosphorylase n=2 Tax=Clonorchis sinensis TaxID=79923 RepID=A0A8T1M7R6_CLOSI|nr:S-methyl-5'-thioadenosine phosphorylase [Clonorchis sinensis]GAA47696.1 5'-methylthioadenosine phosphorylase [Clonorchis sinensis]
MAKVKVGIIGGSGMSNSNILQNSTERMLTTIFGDPSDSILEGTIEGVPCALLARHGRNHSIIPGDVNYRANIWALKTVGCTHILASTACGGLQDYTQPGDFLILDQFIDFSRGREQTLYGGTRPTLEGVLHIPTGEPFCEKTRQVLIESARAISLSVCDRDQGLPASNFHPCVHTRGSAITISGPRFSTKLESKIYRSFGIDLVNMTLVPEVVLAREAAMSYASVAIVTDYDSWKSDVQEVSVSGVLEEFEKSAEKVKLLLINAVRLIGQRDWTKTMEANECLVARSRQDVLHNSNHK